MKLWHDREGVQNHVSFKHCHASARELMTMSKLVQKHNRHNSCGPEHFLAFERQQNSTIPGQSIQTQALARPDTQVCPVEIDLGLVAYGSKRHAESIAHTML